MFDSKEMWEAARLTKRQFVLLDEQKLLPLASGGGGKGKARYWDTESLKRMILIGAFHRAGVELVVSARLIGSGIIESITKKGGLHANLVNLWKTYRRREFPDDGITHDDWKFYTVVSSAGGYHRGLSHPADLIVTITDTGHVFAFGLNMPRGRRLVDDAVAKLDGYHRAGEITVDPIIDHTPNLPMDEAEEILAPLLAEYEHAFKNAESKTEVNVSLSIRNGFDRVIKMRTNY